MTSEVLSKSRNPWLVGLVFAATAVMGGIAIYNSQFESVKQSPTQPTPTVQKITALGRLEPEKEVLHLSAPQALDGDRVAKLLVQEGSSIKSGQVVAILDSRDRLQDALGQAQEQVRVAQARLAQVKAGAKSGEIQAQQATIARIQAELVGEIETQKAEIARRQLEVSNARAEYVRYQQLYREGAISASNIDGKRLAFETAQAQLHEAKSRQSKTASTLQAQLREAQATLNRIEEVRPVDVKVSQTEVDDVKAAVKRAQTELEQAYIRAPMAGQILKIHTYEGEKIQGSENNNDGIAALGQTEHMVVVAEVYQTDIGKVRVGQQAVITGQAFPGELQGKVSQIGLQVNRQNVFSNQPGENLDRRVVEVKIRLHPEDSERVAAFTNLQVQAAIQQ